MTASCDLQKLTFLPTCNRFLCHIRVMQWLDRGDKLYLFLYYTVIQNYLKSNYIIINSKLFPLFNICEAISDITCLHQSKPFLTHSDFVLQIMIVIRYVLLCQLMYCRWWWDVAWNSLCVWWLSVHLMIKCSVCSFDQEW